MAGELGIEIPKGNPGGLESGAASLKSIAGSLERTHSGLVGAGGISGWYGLGAISFVDRSGMVAAAAGSAIEAMGSAAQALTRAASVLEEARDRARDLLEHAREVEQRRLEAIERQREAIERQRTADAQISALSALPGPITPGQDAAISAAGAAANEAIADNLEGQNAEQTAEDQLRQLREKAIRVNERWNDEAIRTGNELAGLSSAAVGMSTAFGMPRPAAGGASVLLAIPPIPTLLNRAQRNAIARAKAEEGFQLDDLRDIEPKDLAKPVLIVGGKVNDGIKQAGKALKSVGQVEQAQECGFALGGNKNYDIGDCDPWELWTGEDVEEAK